MTLRKGRTKLTCQCRLVHKESYTYTWASNGQGSPPWTLATMSGEYVLQRLVLFDIDQTLVSIQGGSRPQRRALDLAFEQVHGIPDAFRDVTFAGGMDLPLMVEVYRKWGLITGGATDPTDLPGLADFKATYFGHLSALLESSTEGVICQGAPDLLEALASNSRVQLGLETGNFREAAFIKLRRYGLDGFFETGGFGGEYLERSQVVASAIVNCQQEIRAQLSIKRCLRRRGHTVGCEGRQSQRDRNPGCRHGLLFSGKPGKTESHPRSARLVRHQSGLGPADLNPILHDHNSLRPVRQHSTAIFWLEGLNAGGG